MALLRPCATSAGYLATQDKPRRVDMGLLKSRLLEAGYAVVIDAKVVLIVRKGLESSLYDNGKVLLKTTDKASAQTAYQELEPHLSATWS